MYIHTHTKIYINIYTVYIYIYHVSCLHMIVHITPFPFDRSCHWIQRRLPTHWRFARRLATRGAFEGPGIQLTGSAQPSPHRSDFLVNVNPGLINPNGCLWLVVTGTWLLFFHILGIIIPTDFHIFQRVETTNQVVYGWGGTISVAKQTIVWGNHHNSLTRVY